MKLYSRGQVVLISIASVLAVFTILIFTGLADFPFLRAAEAGEEVGTDIVAGDSSLGSEPLLQEIKPVRTGDAVYNEDESNSINVYETLNEGVVNITTETLALNWFLEPVPQDGGTGSGSIIDKRGYVLTNYHVVQNAYKVFINLFDGSQFEGTVAGKDPENDLAVVKFNPGDKNLTIIPFGSSANLKVGQKVLAIGNPFGYDRTLTTGIVSGLGRPVRSTENLVIRNMIQTDASINPGNSGGPLINSAGQMIGINTMIYSPSGGSVGIGFAVPVDTARRVVPELMEKGSVERGWIDIYPIQLDPNIVRYAKLPVSQGILVSRLVQGGNAEKAGLSGGDEKNPVRYGRSIIYLGGDIIIRINKTTIAGISDLYSALENTRPGDRAEIEVLRGKQKKVISLILSKRPAEFSWE